MATIDDLKENLAALLARAAEIQQAIDGYEETAEAVESNYDWTGIIGGRERHAMLTGTRTLTGYKIYAVVDDEEPPQGATASEIVDGAEKMLPLTLNGAKFFVQGGIVMANMLKNAPWKGVYHVYAYTDNPYTVYKDADHMRELYGTLPDEAPAVTTAIKKAVTLNDLDR